MKQLACEICGSTEVLKQDGVFVCQSCGTKYTVEEVRKMMGVESDGGANDDPKTVRVDVSDELKNLYQLARRAKNDNNSENAAKYYDMILIKDPTSWEANFFQVYYTASQCKIANICSAGLSVANCVEGVLNLIKDNVTDRNEQIEAVKEVTSHCVLISNMLNNAAFNHYNGISFSIQGNYTQEMVNNRVSARDICYRLGDKIDEIFADYEELHTMTALAWSEGVNIHTKIIPYLSDKVGNREHALKYVEKIKKYTPEYTEPQSLHTTKKNGCYVATAVYGSYDCPQVWTLRRYRDYTLAESWYGRVFIRTYYAISPTLVKLFGNTNWFKKMWQGKLDRMVAKLQAKGVESTPYQDREW